MTTAAKGTPTSMDDPLSTNKNVRAGEGEAVAATTATIVTTTAARTAARREVRAALGGPS